MSELKVLKGLKQRNNLNGYLNHEPLDCMSQRVKTETNLRYSWEIWESILRFRIQVRRFAPHYLPIQADGKVLFIVTCAKLRTATPPSTPLRANQNNECRGWGKLSDRMSVSVLDLSSDMSCIPECRVQKSCKWPQKICSYCSTHWICKS